MDVPRFEGWHLIGRFDSDVGSWLLINDGEAMLLEVPEGLTAADVHSAMARVNVSLRYVTASHDHCDHIDANVWADLERNFPKATFIHPSSVRGDRVRYVGGEPVWQIKAPKHSETDVVTVFRGVAMTGDIELGTLESVNDEVPERTRKRSMAWLCGFEERSGYRVHSTISAHLDDVRLSVNWAYLFRC